MSTRKLRDVAVCGLFHRSSGTALGCSARPVGEPEPGAGRDLADGTTLIRHEPLGSRREDPPGKDAYSDAGSPALCAGIRSGRSRALVASRWP